MSSGDLSNKQRLLIKWAGIKSANEISELTGIAPEDVGREIDAVLNSIDVLTVQQLRAKLLIGMLEANEELRSRFADMSDRNITAAIATYGANTSRIQKEMRDAEKADTGKIEQLNQLRIRELLKMIDETVVISVDEIAALTNIDASELMDVFTRNLVVKAREIEANV